MGERTPGERLDAATARGRLEHEDPEQRHPEPERREDEVLPAGLERAGAAAEADEERGGGGRRLDREPCRAEVPGERNREQNGPEREERGPVDAVGAIGPEERRATIGEELGRDEGACEADDPITPTMIPPAGSTTIHRPSSRWAGSARATAASASAATR